MQLGLLQLDRAIANYYINRIPELIFQQMLNAVAISRISHG